MRILRMLAVALSLGIAVMALSAAPVLAAGGAATKSESGYKEKPPAPKEKVAPAKEKVAPAKEEAAPEKAVAPAPQAVTAPAAEPAPAKTSELPFTGLDLRLVLGLGVLLIAAGGVSLAVTRRRERHDIGR